MKKTLLSVFFCLSVGFAFSQTNGSYRSRQTGNWNQTTTWQVFNSGWNNLESAGAGGYQNILPTNTSGTITISTSTIVTIPGGFETNADQLEFGPSATLQVLANGILNIQNGAGNDVRLYNDGINFSQLLVSGFLRLHRFATMVNDNYAGSVLPASHSTTTNTYKVLNGGGHIHASSDGIPYADWQIGSTMTFYATNTNPVITDVSVQFYNFVWDGRDQIQNLHFFGTLRNVNGRLTVFSTNTRTLNFGSTTSYTMNIGQHLSVQGNAQVYFTNSSTAVLNVGTIANPGNFQVSAGNVICAINGSTTLNVSGDLIMTGGTLSLRTQTTAGGGVTNLNVRGNFSQTGGTITRSIAPGTANINFTGSNTTSMFTKTGGSIVNAINYTVAAAKTLNLGTSALTGSGSFTLFNGSILHVKSTDNLGAIQNNTTGGNIRVSGTRTYQTGSTIVYNGVGTQFMGNGHPPNPNTTIANGDYVYMVASVTINGLLDLVDSLIIDNNTLTLGGTITYTSGYLGIIPQSNVIINGSGNFGDLVLAPVLSANPPNAMNNLTINRSGGTVNLKLDLIVGGSFTQTNGIFRIGEGPGWSLTLRGLIVQTAGSIALFDNPNLKVEGTGAMPANMNFTGTGFERLTMNRVGATFSTNSPLIITDSLSLLNGTVSHPLANMKMGDGSIHSPGGATVLRTLGSITQVLGATTSYEVVYDGSTNITTGNELPFITPVTTRLSDLRKLGNGTVTLNHDIIVNGNFSIENGTFDMATGNDMGIGGNLVVDGTFLTQQSNISFVGSGPQNISGTSQPSFFDLTVNQPGGSTLALGTNVTIQNNFAVNSGSVINAGTERLRLLSTAARTANVNTLAPTASIVGRVIVDRFLPNAAGNVNYRYMSSPVDNSNFTDWTAQLPILIAYRYNEPTRAYVSYPINSTGVLTPGRGFSVFVNSGSTPTYDTRGTLNQGDILVPITSQSSDVTSPDGFNLVGNPYPSAISWLNIDLPNDGSIADAVYVTDNFNNSGQGTATVAVSYIDGVSTPVGFTGQIAQGQAFWVKATANTTLTLTEAAKITPTNTQFYRVAELSNILRITIEGEGAKDETVVRIREGATTKFDPKYDAQKFFQSDVSLATLTSDNAKTVINAFGLSNCNRIVPLIPEVKSTGNYQFTTAGIESFEGQVAVTLIDREENKTLDLRKLKEYHFTVTESNLDKLANRFQISFETKGGVTVDEVAITPEGSTLFSSATEGNQWYFNGVLIEGATAEKLDAVEPGVYSLTTTSNGCNSNATHEITAEDLSNYPTVTVYPNPTNDKVFLRIKTTENNIYATLVNASGLEIETKQLIGDEDIKEGEFDLISHASGIYFLRIIDGTNIYIRKVAKINK